MEHRGSDSPSSNSTRQPVGPTFWRPPADHSTTRIRYSNHSSAIGPTCAALPDILASETRWCNGAPGIAVARLRAAALDRAREADHVAKARIAIATTLEAIDDLVPNRRADATLCHGLSGLIEIAWIAGGLLDEPSYRDRASPLLKP